MSLNIYPLTEIEYSCKNYNIKINGIDATPDTARVSAKPYNRRWPGHQRTLDQTELVNFISLSADEPLDFEITPAEKFEKVEIRPASLGIIPEVKDGVIRFKLEKSAYFTVEPYSRHNALHIFVDPVSDYDINFKNENVIYYGRGIHEAGMITLKSNQTLFIDEGAVVYACVSAADAENIKILGRGILDNSHNKAEILFEANAEDNKSAINNARRIHTIQLEYCKNVCIEGITIRDSLVYNIRPIGCENFSVKNVKLIGNWRYNSDGIDMHNCVNVDIDNCFIRTFDDCICVKGFDCYYEGDVEEQVKNAMYRNGKKYDIFRNVRVHNCTIWNDWGKCLEIGAETRAEEIFDIVFENCDIIHVQGAPLDCYNIDYADVHDIIYRNINIQYDDVNPQAVYQYKNNEKYENLVNDYNSFPPLIRVDVSYHFEYSASGAKRGKNHDIIFENIHLSARQPVKIEFYGYDSEHKTKNVTVKDLYYNGKKITELPKEYFVKNEFCENIKLI